MSFIEVTVIEHNKMPTCKVETIEKKIQTFINTNKIVSFYLDPIDNYLRVELIGSNENYVNYIIVEDTLKHFKSLFVIRTEYIELEHNT